MGLCGRVIIHVNAWELSLDAIMGADNPQACPLIPIPLDIAPTKNWPNKLSRARPLFLALAIGEDPVPFLRADDEGVVVAGKHPTIDLDVPILKWRAHGFYLPLDALLDGREDDPGVGGGEVALRSLLPHEYAQFLSTMFSLTKRARVLRSTLRIFAILRFDMPMVDNSLINVSLPESLYLPGAFFPPLLGLCQKFASVPSTCVEMIVRLPLLH